MQVLTEVQIDVNIKGGYIMQDYIKHLQSQIEYWQRIALAEREKNIKLEEIIKKIEEKIYNLEDKEGK